MVKSSNIFKNDICQRKRNVLLEWIYELTLEYDFHLVTYLRFCYILNYYCSIEKIRNFSKYQLIGSAAFFIAFKYEEPEAMHSRDLVYMGHGSFNHQELIDMESHILKTINMDINYPLSINYLSILGYISKPHKEEFEFLLLYLSFNMELMKYSDFVIAYCVYHIVTTINMDNMIFVKDLSMYGQIEPCLSDIKVWIRNGISNNLPNVSLFKHYCKSKSYYPKYV